MSITYRMEKDEGVIRGKNKIHLPKVCFEILCLHDQIPNNLLSYKNINSAEKCTATSFPEVALWPIQARLALLLWRFNFPPRWPHMRREFRHLREAYKEVQLRRPGCQAKKHLVASRPHRSQLLVNYLLHRCDEMFKKLKQKINEEQSPQRNAQSPQQAQVGS